MAVVSPGAQDVQAERPFLLYFWGRGFADFASQISAVALGWQVFALTNSALDLGLVGLAHFSANALFIFIGGHAADRFERRRIVQLCEAVQALTAAYLAARSFAGALGVAEIFVAVAIFGAVAAFESPAEAALLPGVAPEAALARATAIASAAGQVAVIAGPALGGLAYAISPGVPYAMMAALWALSSMLFGAIRVATAPSDEEPPTLRSIFSGLAFVRRTPAILGTISLDLFAVLLGGATALLPIYARDVFHTGPWGLGLLRGAPAVGALLMAALLARYDINRRAGPRMFLAVIVFGLATLVFALSRSFALSLFALVVMGAADTVSMVVRSTLVQLRTPDRMRGRVGAVKSLFVDASNSLGEFESGVTAALVGAVPAAALGGVGTVAIALLWMRVFPSLRTLDRLD